MKTYLQSWALALALVVLAFPAANANALDERTPTTNNDPTPIKAAAQSLCSDYAYWSGNGYEILNNLWGKGAASSGSQCTYYNGASGDGVNWSSTWSWTGAQDNVKSYAYIGRQITRKLVSQINKLPTKVHWYYGGQGVRANVAYDIFTSANKDHVNSSGDYELMIWLGRLGGVWPISQSGSPIARVNIGGYNWDLYFGYNGAMKVYSFLSAQGDIQDFTADVKQFFTYLTSNQGFPASQQYMLMYQYGTEAFTSQGQVTFNCPYFAASLE